MDPNLDSAIRLSVAAGDFSRARRLWNDYVRQCANEIRNSPDPKAALERARQLMVWCRQMALASRAQAQAQLHRLINGISVAAAYSQSSRPTPGPLRSARY
jgi:hypothetical protein